MSLSVEEKLRTLAQQDPTMQAWFLDANGTFRWFDTQLVPGYLKIGKACLTVLNVSTYILQAHPADGQQGVLDIEFPRLQITIFDFDANRAKNAASDVRNWLASVVDCSTGDQFASPPVTPKRHPVQFLNERKAMETSTQPAVHVRILDVRIANLAA